ncbi:MAG: hypothetical protein D3914_06180, partial [Candidatus Electrothrix sp. LOE2]|nr:hypothetical protein [Candidatus Electrothrix sp. LOE2]
MYILIFCFFTKIIFFPSNGICQPDESSSEYVKKGGGNEISIIEIVPSFYKRFIGNTVKVSPRSVKVKVNRKELHKKKNNYCRLPEDIIIKETIENKLSFKQWVDFFKEEALSHGISPRTVIRALHDIRPVQKAIELDRRQKEYSITFSKYLNQVISPARINRGKIRRQRYSTLL